MFNKSLVNHNSFHCCPVVTGSDEMVFKSQHVVEGLSAERPGSHVRGGMWLCFPDTNSKTSPLNKLIFTQTPSDSDLLSLMCILMA